MLIKPLFSTGFEVFSYNVRFDTARDNIGAVEDVWEGMFLLYLFVCRLVCLCLQLCYFTLEEGEKPSHEGVMEVSVLCLTGFHTAT